MYILRVTDFETTGIPKDDEKHSIIEAACVDIETESKNRLGTYQSLVVPTTEMSIQALATHHISAQEATESGFSWESVQDTLLENDGSTVIYVAHNADFEKQFFNPEGSLWIDTYKVALVLYPDAPSHSNQVLKYYLGIENKPEHHPPHRALPDCFVTAEILLKMAEQKTFNEMIQISKEPPFLTKIGFGKHRGQKFEDLPKDYLQWLSGQKDMDAAVIAAAKRYLYPRTIERLSKRPDNQLLLTVNDVTKHIWTKNSFYNQFAKVCEKAGMKGFVFRKIRNSAAIYGLRFNLTDSQFRQRFGWSKDTVEQMRNHYTDLDQEVMVAAAAKVKAYFDGKNIQ